MATKKKARKKVTVTYEGANTIPALRVMTRDGKMLAVNLLRGQASFFIPVGTKCKLFWLVIGPPEAKYKITLSTTSSSVITVNRNPIKLKIPNGNAGYGREVFKISVKP